MLLRSAIPDCITLGKLIPLELSFFIYKMGMVTLPSREFMRIKWTNINESPGLGEKHNGCSIKIYQIGIKEEEGPSCPKMFSSI